ncbi:MAG: hypothetical protein Q7U40_06430 [Desulfatirhabdiaceae bacterium]|nr:hypothetical protein [Desulfatirhabdiaceae bacterium]
METALDIKGVKTMKSVIQGIIIVLLSITLASAAPFLISDPVPSAVGASFEIQEKTGVVVAVKPSQADGSISYDLQSLAIGNYDWQIRYVVDNGVWGKAYSAFFPFVFKRPGIAIDPIKGLRLAP